MKVLVVSPTFPPMRSGGAEYALRLCQRLAERGLDLHVVTSEIAHVATDPSMRVSPVMRRWSWLELHRLLQMARGFRPDVVDIHFHGQIYNDHPMITFAPTVLKRAMPGVRVVTHIEWPVGVRPQILPRSTRAVRKIAARWAGPRDADYGYGTLLRDSDRVIVLSDAHRPMLSAHFAGVDQKCRLIPPPPLMRMCTDRNGASRQEGRTLLGVAPDEFVFAYFGYLYPGKGIETLLQAFSAVVQRNPRSRLVMLGGGNELILKEMKRPHYVQELQESAARLGIAEKIRWSGYYPTESDEPSLSLWGADACVLPFDMGVFLNNSSFGTAAAHGLPIITTRGDTIEPPFIDGESVLLCPPKDSASLSAAMERVIVNSELRHRLRAGARELERQWFSWDTAVTRTIEAFSGA
jgi:glycosyltransferase involved in cell wall biosynthesis